MWGPGYKDQGGAASPPLLFPLASGTVSGQRPCRQNPPEPARRINAKLLFFPVKKDQADDGKSTEAFHTALTAAIRLRFNS